MIEMTTTARGTRTPRLRGANIDRISAATRRAVWGSWTPEADMDNAPEFELAAREAEMDDLLDLVPVETPERPAVPMASDAQKRWITTLAQERGVAVDVDKLTKREASAKIDELKALPRSPRPAAGQPAELEDGVYILDGTVYKVRHAIHGSGRQYATRLQAPEVKGENGEWIYVGQAPLGQLRPEHKLTRETASGFGALYGVCARCGRALTAEDSIERMVGSTCWGKL